MGFVAADSGVQLNRHLGFAWVGLRIVFRDIFRGNFSNEELEVYLQTPNVFKDRFGDFHEHVY